MPRKLVYMSWTSMCPSRPALGYATGVIAFVRVFGCLNCEILNQEIPTKAKGLPLYEKLHLGK